MTMSIFPRGTNFDSKRGEEEEVAKMGKRKGDDGSRGRPSHRWMMVSIQASVRFQLDFNWYQFFNSCKIYACFDCVVINHQKRGDYNENGPIRLLFCDFGD